MTHPCADHMDQCDHCSRCEAGECCRTPPPGQAAYTPVAVVQPPDRLHDAVVADAKTAVALGELVRLSTGRPGLAVLLLPSAAAEPIPNDSRKEAERVSITRALR